MSHILRRLRGVCNMRQLPAKSFDMFAVINVRWVVKIKNSVKFTVRIILGNVTLMESSEVVTK